MRQSSAYCLDVAVVGEARTSSVVPARAGRPPAAQRITSGALVCIARWGTAKTTLDDIAREAGCSRATIYRLYPGGKRAVLDATGEVELARILEELSASLDRTETLDDLLVVAISEAVRAIRRHPALQYLIEHEPGEVLAHVSFDELDPLLAVATAFGTPYLSRYLGPGPRRGHRRVGHPPHRLLRHRTLPRSRRPGGGPHAGRDLRPSRPRRLITPDPASLNRSQAMSSTEASSTEDLIGRSDVNDIEAILSVSNTDVDELVHTVADNAEAIFTWDYEKGARPALNKLYEKAKTSQWNGETDLAWDTEVDQEAVVMANAAANPSSMELDLAGTSFEHVGRGAVAAAGHRVAELGAAASSCTASRAPCCARPRSSRPCRGSTPSTTPPPR